MPPSSDPCPRCGSPRAAGPECPRCGVIYAKAEARVEREFSLQQALAEHRAAQQRGAAPPTAASTQREAEARGARQDFGAPARFPEDDPGSVPWQAPDLRSDVLPPEGPSWARLNDEDTTLELKLRTWALPATLLVAWFVMTGPLRGMLRVFVTMIVHECGHAVTAWLCGFLAIPSLWVTPTSSTRWYALAALLAAGLGVLTWLGWKRNRRAWMAWGVGLLCVQLVCTLGLSVSKAQALIYFGGDGGMMVLGTLLMATFYTREGSYIRENGLRWGFLPMGALAFMDSFVTWWRARKDVDEIPFGEIEGTGLSDPSALVQEHGWTVGELIRRYVALGITCLIILAVLYAVNLYRARLRAGFGATSKGHVKPG